MKRRCAQLVASGARASMGLFLHYRALRIRITSTNDQITALGRGSIRDNLADRPDGVDDGGAGRIGHELGKRLNRTRPVGFGRQSERERLLGRQAGDGGLQDLDLPLIEQSDLALALA